MASHATLRLNRLVFKNKWPLFVSVARVAYRISRRRRAEVLADESAVRVMTIRTLNKPFFHAMVERHVELRFYLLMAGIAQIGLRLDQQKLSGRGVMGGMAVEAAQVVVAMSRPGKVHMIFA